MTIKNYRQSPVQWTCTWWHCILQIQSYSAGEVVPPLLCPSGIHFPDDGYHHVPWIWMARWIHSSSHLCKSYAFVCVFHMCCLGNSSSLNSSMNHVICPTCNATGLASNFWQLPESKVFLGCICVCQPDLDQCSTLHLLVHTEGAEETASKGEN